MTHSPTTDDGDFVDMDPVDRLRDAWCHEYATWGDDGSAEFERILARIKADAVAEHKAQGVSDAEIEVAQHAFHEFVHGDDEPLTAREKNITKNAWRVALTAAKEAKS